MMRLFLLFCLFLVLGGVVFQQVEKDPGYILVVWGSQSIEMSLWFGLLAIMVFMLLLWLLIALFRGGFRGLRSLKDSLLGYSRHKAQQQTTNGLLHFIEGNWKSAKKQLTRSAEKAPAPVINYLAAARCAYESGDEQEALQLLHKAEKCEDVSELAVCLTQVRMHLANHQYEQASASLERAANIDSDQSVVLHLQQQVYIELKDWEALKKLLPKLHKHDIGSVKERYKVELDLYYESFSEVIQKSKSVGSDEKQTLLKEFYSSVPSHLQQEEKLLSLYAKELISFKQYDAAEHLLANGLRRKWHDVWVYWYGLLNCDDAKKTLKTAEGWLKNQSESPMLLLTLGRLCLQNQQWGRAKDYFETSLEQQSHPETYAELARLQNYLGELQPSHDACRQGLLSSVKALASVAEFEKK